MATLAVVGGLGLLLALIGLVTSGVAGGLVLLGLTAVVLGLGGVLVGRPGWALIRRRRHGAAILGAGLVALALGSVAAPATPTATVADPVTTTRAPTTTQAPTTTTAVPTTDPVAGAAPGTALAALGTLAVKGRAPQTGYDRTRFGNGFVDTDHNGCDTRDDVLDRDLGPDLVIKPGTRGCVALSGTLHDPYTGTDLAFVRTSSSSSPVEIDHVVALSDAWQKGAQRWDDATRVAFANDPLELLAVDAGANSQKGDGDAATWLPSNTAVRCAYVARQVTVKARYGLWVTDAERAAIAGVLARCPDEPTTSALDAAGDRVVRQQAQITADRTRASQAAAETQAAAAAQQQAAVAQQAQPKTSDAAVPPATTDAAPPASSDSTYFKNCTEAHDAGAAPMRRGEPGYRLGLDRDGDGIACDKG